MLANMLTFDKASVMPVVTSHRLLVDHKSLGCGNNNFPGAYEAAGDNKAVSGDKCDHLTRLVRDDARAFEHEAVLFFGLRDPPFAWLTSPNADKELIRGVGVVHPDGLLGITADQLLSGEEIDLRFHRRVELKNGIQRLS